VSLISALAAGLIAPPMMATTMTAELLRLSFEQRLRILAPVLSDEDEKRIGAAWASMSSRGDFERVTLEMNKIATDHKITLPEADAN
jgi:hypothetical protein